MGALISLIAVAVLALLAAVGASAGDSLRFGLGVIVPGVAFAVFLGSDRDFTHQVGRVRN
jgi:hypothetical protein